MQRTRFFQILHQPGQELEVLVSGQEVTRSMAMSNQVGEWLSPEEQNLKACQMFMHLHAHQPMLGTESYMHSAPAVSLGYLHKRSHFQESARNAPTRICKVGLYLRLHLCHLRLVFVAYGQLSWSFLLRVEIRFGLFCLRWKIGLVFFTYGSPPVRKLGLVFLACGSPLGLVFFAYVSSTISKKDEP